MPPSDQTGPPQPPPEPAIGTTWAERRHLSDLCRDDDGTGLVCLSDLPCAEHPADAPEPASPPAQDAHDAPGGADGHPGTLDGPAVLGRALIDADGDVWPESATQPGTWRVPSGKTRGGQTVVEVVAVDPPARVVLLVRPEVGRVLEAARAWREAYEDGDGLEYMQVRQDLATAVDALDQPTAGGPDRDAFAASRDAANRQLYASATNQTGVRLCTTCRGPIVDHGGGRWSHLADGYDDFAGPHPARSAEPAPIPPLDLTDHQRQAALAEVQHREPTGGDTLRSAASQLARSTVWADPFGRWTADQAEAAGAQKQVMVDRLLTLASDAERPPEGLVFAPEPSPLDRLRADHLLIPKAGVVGYRVMAADGYLTVHPADVEIVLRGDLGQEGDHG